VIEAAAYGLGVVASRIGGIPELVQEGRTGLLFEPGDAAGLAAAMRGLTGGAIGLPDLAEASWDLACLHRTAGMADEYCDQYQALLAGRPLREGGRDAALAA